MDDSEIAEIEEHDRVCAKLDAVVKFKTGRDAAPSPVPALIAEIRRLRKAIYKIIFDASDGPDIWRCPLCLAEGNDPHADSCMIFDRAGTIK